MWRDSVVWALVLFGLIVSALIIIAILTEGA